MLFRGVLVCSLGCHASLVGSNLSLFPFIYKSVLNYALNSACRFYMFKGPELWGYGSSSEFLCFFLCNALGIPESMAGNKLELF